MGSIINGNHIIPFTMSFIPHNVPNKCRYKLVWFRCTQQVLVLKAYWGSHVVYSFHCIKVKKLQTFEKRRALVELERVHPSGLCWGLTGGASYELVGAITGLVGKPNGFHGENHGFRRRFSLQVFVKFLNPDGQGWNQQYPRMKVETLMLGL